MNVGELRRALDGVPDDLIVLAFHDGRIGYFHNGVNVELGRSPQREKFDKDLAAIGIHSIRAIRGLLNYGVTDISQLRHIDLKSLGNVHRANFGKKSLAEIKEAIERRRPTKQQLPKVYIGS